MIALPKAEDLASVPAPYIIFSPNKIPSPEALDIEHSLVKKVNEFIAEKKNDIIKNHHYLTAKRDILAKLLDQYHSDNLPSDLSISFKPTTNYPRYISAEEVASARAIELEIFQQAMAHIFYERLIVLLKGYNGALDSYVTSLTTSAILSSAVDSLSWLRPLASHHDMQSPGEPVIKIYHYITSQLAILLTLHADKLASTPLVAHPPSTPMMVVEPSPAPGVISDLVKQNKQLFKMVTSLQSTVSTLVNTRSNRSTSRRKNESGGSTRLTDPSPANPIRISRSQERSPSRSRSALASPHNNPLPSRHQSSRAPLPSRSHGGRGKGRL